MENELKLKQLLHNIINNFNLFDYDGVLIRLKYIDPPYNTENIEYVKTYPYKLEKISYDYSFFGIFCKTVVKEYFDTYISDEFTLLFPDGQPNLNCYSISNHKEEKIDLPWYKKIIGMDCVKYSNNIDYYLSFGDIKTELTYIEVDDIFKLLNLKKIEYDNNVIEQNKNDNVIKLNERFELYK